MYTEQQIRENPYKVCWDTISCTYKLSESFIKEFENKVNWNCISIYQKLSESFIIEFKNKINWFGISIDQKLSETFIRKFKNSVRWDYISQYQKLSESFITEFQNSVHWDSVCAHQKLSEIFIKKFKDKVDWDDISYNQILSKTFIEKFANKINTKIQLANHHNSLSYEQKFDMAKCYAKKYHLRCNQKYLYAYREHDEFNKGMYNKTICYDKKKMYIDWRCNLNIEIACSFGLGIFPKGNIKVRIKIKDIGCWPNNTNKLRVWAFEII